MSYKSFEKALRIAPQCSDYDIDKGTSKALIRKAEKLLGVRFSKQARYFYKKYNYMSFCGYEIDGIDPNSSFPLGGNAVASALADRKKYGLPEKWIPLCFLDDGCYAYMDYSQLNAEGEPRIIEAVYTNGEHWDELDCDDLEESQYPKDGCRYTITDVLAEDFGEYLLGLVELSLEIDNQPIDLVDSVPAKNFTNEQNQAFKSIDDKLDEIDRLLAELRKLQEKE